MPRLALHRSRREPLDDPSLEDEHQHHHWEGGDDSRGEVMLDAAKGIVEKFGAPSDEAKREYAAFVNSLPQLSGGERAYRYLDDCGRVYQSVSLRAPAKSA